MKSGEFEYENIVLLPSERKALKKLLKAGKELFSSMPETQSRIFLAHGLVYRDTKVRISEPGRVLEDPGSPVYLIPTDKAERFLIYRWRKDFWERFPTIISLAALVLSAVALWRSW